MKSLLTTLCILLACGVAFAEDCPDRTRTGCPPSVYDHAQGKGLDVECFDDEESSCHMHDVDLSEFAWHSTTARRGKHLRSMPHYFNWHFYYSDSGRVQLNLRHSYPLYCKKDNDECVDTHLGILIEVEVDSSDTALLRQMYNKLIEASGEELLQFINYQPFEDHVEHGEMK